MPTLSYDELTTVRKNLQRENIEVDTDYIRQTWFPVYRRYYIRPNYVMLKSNSNIFEIPDISLSKL